ncbi:MAG TPA: elongation factor P [Deltaproteobacteria bacterium]|nr:MAG: elongation factor P [Deltaproteobacteria bacterium GWA2_45_12]HBF12222.1 elongation factor P [Deltaproteobacteria bacterium]
MSIQASQLRPGMVIDKDGFLWQCLESVHKTPGNLRAFIQAKMRNLKNGTQKEFRFSSTETLEKVDLREKSMQFLYNDDGGYHFMDMENYEQIQINKEFLGNNVFYLIPEGLVNVTFHDSTPVGLVFPQTLSFKVIEAEPNMKSATATSSYKNAKIETGLIVKVPQFIEVGDKITIKTESGDYVTRVKE